MIYVNVIKLFFPLSRDTPLTLTSIFWPNIILLFMLSHTQGYLIVPIMEVYS